MFLVLPKLLPFSFGEEPSFLGDSTTVQCSLSSGDMPVKFTWSLNNKPISDVQGIVVGSFGKKTSVVSIESLDEHHAGNYTCFASNKAGIARSSSVLIVKGNFC